MLNTIILCGRSFSPELLHHLEAVARGKPAPSRNALAREVCAALAWYSPDGRPALSSAKVALRKLHKRGLISLPPYAHRRSGPHRLRPSGQELPALGPVPTRLERVRGLHLYLLADAQDPRHGLWNDLMITQHPCGDAPLVGTQLRYLIGSEHGWLGALGFGSAAFVLPCRDLWIGWSTAARLNHLPQVIGLSRVLLRTEVHCPGLLSQVLGLAVEHVGTDWQQRYGVRPLLVETYVDRSHFQGTSLSAANWQRVGTSRGRGRLGAVLPTKTPKDVWLYSLAPEARPQLQAQEPPPLSPAPLTESLAQPDWVAQELASLDLGDVRRNERAQAILAARWAQPQASFYGSFEGWTPAKGAYGLIEHKSADISLEHLLAPHAEQTQARMVAEPVALLVQDTTGLNYSGLKETTGLGPLGEDKGQGLWLHSLLALRPDGVPLGVLEARCWARSPQRPPGPGRNAQSLDEKESARWVETFLWAAQVARRMPQTQLVALADREGDLYELYDAVQECPPNLHVLVRAQHDRNLPEHQKLWAFMAEQPLGEGRTLDLPRAHGQAARKATVEVRWAQVTLQPPAVGHKKGWSPLSLWAVWVHEPQPPQGVAALDWMLLTDRPVSGAEDAWEKVQWYCKRWGIEEWHRALKNGCGVEQREFKTAEHLQRVLAFDLIIAWRVLACLKLGRVLPQLPATVLYTPEELEVLLATIKKKTPSAKQVRELTLREANRLVARLGGYAGRKGDGEPGAESVGIGLRRLHDLCEGWKLGKKHTAQRFV